MKIDMEKIMRSWLYWFSIISGSVSTHNFSIFHIF